MSIFLLIATIIFGTAHYYVFERICDYFNLSPNVKIIIFWCFTLLCFFMVALLPLMRRISRAAASFLAWSMFSWMGILMFLVISFLAGDILLIGFDIAKLAGVEFFHRGYDIKYIMGWCTIIAAITLTCVSFRNALLPAVIKHVSIKLKKLPKEMSGFKIVQLTDIHIGPTISGKTLINTIKRVNALSPDIIAITGDLVDGSVAELKGHIIHLQELRAKYGVYFVTGNHEFYSGVKEWVGYLRSIGINVLQNQCVTITHDSGKLINIAGVEDYYGNHDMQKALEGRDENVPVILLAHQPLSIIEAAKYNVDLQLSGHTHGGQIWPWNYAVLLQQPYVRGLHKRGNTYIYISCGTGYWGPPMRLGTRSEITEISLVSK